MRKLTRRDFMALSAAAAAGSVVGPAVTRRGVARSAAANPATTGTLSDVKHIVVLMQENRSFDHYFGMLKGVRGFGDRSSILLPGGNPIFRQPSGAGFQYPWPLNTAGSAASSTTAQCDGSLDHGWSTQHAAWSNGRLDSWVSAKKDTRTMGYLSRGDIPFHYALADAYTVCDSYHCAILSATGPNRTYLWGGMIDPGGQHGGPAYDGGDESGLTWQTYAESLQNAGVSWKVYQNASDNYGDNGLAFFSQFSSAATGSTLYQRGMSSVPSTGSTPDDIAAAIRNDVVNNTLPQVSWVVPNMAFSEHPDAPPQDGAHFINLVLQALAANSAVFDSTVFILNYDENDGFFDHVPPPSPVSGTADEFVNGTAIGMGFRVPMVIVSPWTRGGWVDSRVYDHTSVIRFMERWTAAIGKPASCSWISAWRRAVSGDLTTAFDFANPVYGLPSLPSTSKVIGEVNCRSKANPAPQSSAMPVQESGTKPARALPYQPNGYVDHLEFDSNGKTLVWLTMTNTGAQAAQSVHLASYANAYRSGGPWQYTLPPYNASTKTDGSASDYFNVGAGYGEGKYDLSIVGPNRFLRRFIGDTTAAGHLCEVQSQYAIEPGTGQLAIYFNMKNTGASAVTFTIVSNQYRTWNQDYPTAAGATSSDYFNAVAYNNGWYDFTITLRSDPSWSRRFAGHLENGAASVTG